MSAYRTNRSHVWVVFAMIATLYGAAVPPAAAQATLGVPLPGPLPALATLTQGGAPNFADTFLTPFVSSVSASVFDWKAQFVGGTLNNGNCGIPIGIQLKVFRAVSATQVKVVAAGAVHNPLTALQARFNTTGCPSFLIGSVSSVLQFDESGLTLSPGDMIGVTIKSDPSETVSPGYFYPLASTATTRVVLRDVGLNGTIDLSDPFTGTLGPLTPALSVNLGLNVSIDIKPGSAENTVNLSSAGVVPVAIFSSPSFDALRIDPETLFLAGAGVGMVGKSGKFQCQQRDVNGDNLMDLVCDFDTAHFLLHTGETLAQLSGATTGGVSIRGQDSIRIVPD